MSAWAKVEKQPGAWVEITDEDYWEALEVMPPIYFSGGFAVSEPTRHTAEDVPVYLCIKQLTTKDGVSRSWAREATIAEARAAPLPL